MQVTEISIVIFKKLIIQLADREVMLEIWIAFHCDAVNRICDRLRLFIAIAYKVNRC